MKKILIVIIIAAAAVGGYWVYQQKILPINTSSNSTNTSNNTNDSNSTSDNSNNSTNSTSNSSNNSTSNNSNSSISSNTDSVLSSIPADTIYFSGQFTPLSVKNYFNYFVSVYGLDKQNLLALKENAKTPRDKFIVEILFDYATTAKDNQTLTDTFGLPAKIRSYFYALGVIPVLKIDIANPDKLWALLDKAEAASGFSHETHKVGNVSYRSYLLSNPDLSERLSLILAANNGMLTATIATSINDKSLIGVALGVTPVANPLNKSGIIEGVVNKYNLTKDGLSFTNFRRIVTALTTKDSSLMATQLTQINRLLPIENQETLKTLRTQTCRTELNAISENWPRIVSGYTKFALKNDLLNASMKIIIETKNQPILSALKSIRGSIPAYTQDSKNTMLALGLGINVDALAPAITNIWQELTTPTYQCAPLNTLQAEIKQNNPATLAMFTGTVREIKGLSIALINYSFVDNDPDKLLKSLDAIVSLSAKNPANLYNKIKSSLPSKFARIDLPKDGSAVTLNGSALKINPKIKVNMAIKGDHLVGYSGVESNKIAQDIATESLSSNGILALTINYSKLFVPVAKMLAMQKKIPLNLKNYRIKFKMDVNDNGIVSKWDIQQNSSK